MGTNDLSAIVLATLRQCFAVIPRVLAVCLQRQAAGKQQESSGKAVGEWERGTEQWDLAGGEGNRAVGAVGEGDRAVGAG